MSKTDLQELVQKWWFYHKERKREREYRSFLKFLEKRQAKRLREKKWREEREGSK